MLILVAALFCLPEAVLAPDHFENPRRLLWAGLAVGLLAVAAWRRNGSLLTGGAPWALALAGWMTVRTLVRGAPFIELEVLATWLLPPLLFLAGRTLGVAARPRLGVVCLLLLLLQGALALAQRQGWDPLFPATTATIPYAPGRMLGTIGYQNQLIDALAVCAAVVIAWRPRLAWALLPAMLFLVAMAAYRSGLMALLLASALGAVLALAERRNRVAPRARRRSLALTVIGVLLMAGLAAGLTPGMRTRLSEVRRSGLAAAALSTRLTMARAAVAMWRERPLCGWGGGAFAFQYGRRMANLLPSEPRHADLQRVVMAREAHNDVLQLGAEFGCFGLLLAAGWLAAVARALWRQRQAAPHAALAGALLLAYLGVVALTAFPWHYAVAGPLAACCLGALTAPVTTGGSEVRSAARRRGASALALAGCLLAALCGAFFLSQGFADRAVAHATRGRLPLRLPWRGHPRQLAQVGGELAAQGKWAAARAALVSARRGTWSTILLNNLGHVQTREKDWEGALAVYREWSASGIDHAYALANEAAALEHLKRPAEAGRLLLRKHRLWPTDSSAAELRRTALLLLQGGELDSAAHLVDQYEARCLERRTLGGWSGEWENLSGAIALRRGDRATARRRFQQALRLAPELESARRNLAILDADAGDAAPR